MSRCLGKNAGIFNLVRRLKEMDGDRSVIRHAGRDKSV